MSTYKGNAAGRVRLDAMRLVIGASVFAMAAAMSGAAWAQATEPAGEDGPVPVDAVADEPAGSGEIVVTAQFREQKLQDTPIAITAVTGAMLEARGQTNLAEVAAQAPSVVLKPATAAFGPSITASIRGMGQIDFNPAFEPGVGIYVDDVYYPRLTGANFDLLDVERIEILRGPQGTLSGRNSEGGTIRFISRRPNGAGGGYLAATYGSRNRIGLRGSADFTVAEDLFARISGTFADQEGYVEQIDFGCANPPGSALNPAVGGVTATRPAGNCTVSKFGDVGYKALKGILRWNPSDAIDAMISADYIRDSRNTSAEVLLYANNPNPNVMASPAVGYDNRFVCGNFCNYSTNGQPAGTFQGVLAPPNFPLAATAIDNQSEYTGWGVSGNLVIDVTDRLELTSISAYRTWNSQFEQDGDLSPANVLSSVHDLDSEFWSQELRVNAELTDWATLTVGGYYADETTVYLTRQDIRFVAAPTPFGLLPLFPLQFVGDDPVETKSKALFGTVIIRPTDALTFTGGLRYTKESKDYTFFRYDYDGTTINPFVDPVGAAYGIGYIGLDPLDADHDTNRTETVEALSGKTASFRGNRWDYRASLDYRFSPQLLAYATVSTGFKGGGVGSRPFNAAQAQPFGPEKLTAYEVGFKTDLFDRTLRFNVSAYYNQFKDAQLTLLACPQFGGPGPCALPQNAGNADVKGIEAELFFRPIEGLQIDASGSLLDWDWKCVSPQVVDPTSVATGCSTDPALVGQLVAPPRGVSKVQWSIGAEYELDLASAGSLTPRIDVAHQGKLFGTVTTPVPGSPSDLFATTGSYTLANARLTWRNAERDLDVTLEVTNVLNKIYFLNKFDLTGAGSGTISGMPGRPREFAVTVKKKF